MPTRRRERASNRTIRAAVLLWLILPVAVQAHVGNRVQLYGHQLAIRPAGPGEWTVEVAMIDADSGAPAPGFDVVARGTTAAGRFGPTALGDPDNAGRYEANVSGEAGPWTLTVEAAAALGGEPAVPFARTWNVVVTEAGFVSSEGENRGSLPRRALSGSAAPALDVALERGQEPGPNEFYVHILVTVLDQASGQPGDEPFDVFATAANRAGEKTEVFPLVELPDPGRHSGFVIVPHGGQWTVTAAVNNRHDERTPKPRVTYARASLEIDVAAGALTSARTPTGAETAPAVNIADLAVMWLHVLVGLGWLVAAGLLAVMASPAGRRMLSEPARSYLEQRLPTIARGATWFAGLVLGSGVYHLARSVPYRVPLSASAAEQVFRLPYAEPYFLVLAVKLVAFAATVPVTAGHAGGARRLAVGGDDRTERRADSTATRLDPWKAPTAALVGAQRAEAGPAGLSAPSLPSAAGITASSASRTPVAGHQVASARSRRRGLLPAFVLLAAATTITAAVTALKYLHILSEASRSAP